MVEIIVFRKARGSILTCTLLECNKFIAVCIDSYVTIKAGLCKSKSFRGIFENPCVTFVRRTARYPLSSIVLDPRGQNQKHHDFSLIYNYLLIYTNLIQAFYNTLIVNPI